jgi:DNA-binding transcriptional regulator YdaS (Cro superfamily)
MNKLTEYLDTERGRRIALAAALKVSPGAISQWDRVPAERVLDVERITGISRHELRPDLYPLDGEAA